MKEPGRCYNILKKNLKIRHIYRLRILNKYSIFIEQRQIFMQMEAKLAYLFIFNYERGESI